MSNTNSSQWYWLVGGGPMQIRALEHLKERNFKIILTDGNSECPGKNYADLFFELDIHDLDSHLLLIEGPLFELKSKIRGISCIATDSHKTVAGLAQELDLPGIPLTLSEIIGDKDKLRETLTKIGVKQPRYLSFSSEEDISNVLDSIKMSFTSSEKILVKPLGWSASKGIKELENPHACEPELIKAFNVSRNGRVIVEEILFSDGKLASESSIETLVQKGKVTYLNMVDRVFGSDLKHFSDYRIPKKLNLGVEYGIISPSSRSDKEIESITRQLQELINYLTASRLYENQTFILKADILFSTKGPIIIEATPRTSGGWDSSYTSPTRGMRIQELALEVSLGNSVLCEEWISSVGGFVAVVSDANSESIDCLGRTFYGGDLSDSPSAAIASALDVKDRGLSL